MLLMLLLLIPIAGLFLITTTMYNDNSHSNIKQIKVTGLVTSIINLFFSLIVFVRFILLNLFKFLLYIKINLDTKAIGSCIIICLSCIALSYVNSLEFTTKIVFYLLMLSSLILLYLVYFGSSIANKYPKISFFILVMAGIIILICLIVLILKFSLGFDAILWLISKWKLLKQYLVRTQKTDFEPKNTKCDKPDSNQNNPNNNNNSGSVLTPEEKKKRKKEANARYREKNREKIKSDDKEYRKKNKDKIAKTIKTCRKNNPEKYKQIQKKSFNTWFNKGDNKEKMRVTNAKWREDNPDKVKRTQDIHSSKRKQITEENRKDMEQYEGILKKNQTLFDSWLDLSPEQLQDVFKKKRINKNLQGGFLFYKANPNYYDDLDLDLD